MNVMKIFKEVGFKIEIQKHLKIVNFSDMIFNLANGTYRLYKKANESSLYINTSYSHPSQVIKQLPTSITKRLSNNSSNEEISNALKYEYETALKNSSYQQTKLIFRKKEQRKQKRIRNQNIIWFNPPFSRNVTTNVAKRFLNLLDIYFLNRTNSTRYLTELLAVCFPATWRNTLLIPFFTSKHKVPVRFLT